MEETEVNNMTSEFTNEFYFDLPPNIIMENMNLESADYELFDDAAAGFEDELSSVSPDFEMQDSKMEDIHSCSLNGVWLCCNDIPSDDLDIDFKIDSEMEEEQILYDWPTLESDWLVREVRGGDWFTPAEEPNWQQQSLLDSSKRTSSKAAANTNKALLEQMKPCSVSLDASAVWRYLASRDLSFPINNGKNLKKNCTKLKKKTASFSPQHVIKSSPGYSCLNMKYLEKLNPDFVYTDLTKTRRTQKMKTPPVGTLPGDKECNDTANCASLYQCPYCLCLFNAEFEIRYHLSQKISRNTLIYTIDALPSAYECNNCLQLFDSQQHFHTHMQSKHGSLVKCESCDTCFTYICELNKHQHTVLHFHNFAIKCEKCSLDFPNKYCLDYHNFIFHESLHVCHICGLSYQNSTKLSYHMYLLHGTKTMNAVSEPVAVKRQSVIEFDNILDIKTGIQIESVQVKKEFDTNSYQLNESIDIKPVIKQEMRLLDLKHEKETNSVFNKHKIETGSLPLLPDIEIFSVPKKCEPIFHLDTKKSLNFVKPEVYISRKPILKCESNETVAETLDPSSPFEPAIDFPKSKVKIPMIKESSKGKKSLNKIDKSHSKVAEVVSKKLFDLNCGSSVNKSKSLVCSNRIDCEICTKSYATLGNLKKHHKKHHPAHALPSLTSQNRSCIKQKVKKDVCNVKTKNSNHVKTIKPSILILHRCKFCKDKFFKTSEALQKHIDCFHGYDYLDGNCECTIQCKYCPKMLENDSSLYIHMVVKHYQFVGYECKACVLSFETPHLFVTHFKNEHSEDKMFKCRFCLAAYPSSHFLGAHLMRNHNKRIIHCLICSQDIILNRYFLKHFRECCNYTQSFYPCCLCGELFNCASIMKEHMLNNHVHPNTYTFHCDICSNLFFSKYNLKWHLKTKHLTKRELKKFEKLY